MANELIKQAIADAKALRQSAYELAKEQIAETFGPRVQEMIRLKLSEMEDTESLPEEKKMEEEGKKMEHEAKHMEEEGKKMETEGEDMVDEATLDELLAELEMEEEGKKMEEEGKHMEEEGKKIEEAEGDEEESEEAEEEEGEEAGEEAGEEPAEEVTELSVEELKDIIRDVVADVMASGAPGETLEPEAGAEGGEEVMDLGADSVAEGGVDEITLDEILASLEEADKEPTEEGKHMEEEGKHMEEEGKKVEEVKAQLQEAYKTIKTLQTEMADIKLLNAKLMYVNKIFNSKSLNESQKLKVINAFDRAENVKEAKKIYETLKDSFNGQPSVAKKTIKESIGFASKPAGMIPKVKPIVEQNDIVNRWQVLAGIKKIN